jgi:hypothetical protein
MDIVVHTLTHAAGCHGEWQIILPWLIENLSWISSRVPRVSWARLTKLLRVSRG